MAQKNVTSHQRKVLVIDDDLQLCEAIEAVLSGLGLQVLIADELTQAKKQITTQLPSLILLDIKLKNQSGLELVEQMSSGSLGVNIPIIILTGIADRSLVTKTVGMGVKDFLVKPFTNPVLIKKVQRILKFSDFLAYEFNTNDRPVVRAGAFCKLMGVNEISLVFNSPIKMASNAQIWIESPILDRWNVNSTTIQTTMTKAGHIPGTYDVEANFIGLTPYVINQIKKATRTNE